MSTKSKLCLVIPCYNEEKRLDLAQFAKHSNAIVFIFVDDGSTDGTKRLIETNLPENSKILGLGKNSGKAEAVRQGMLYAEKDSSMKDIEWFGFWDADLSTPLDEAAKMLNFAGNMNPVPDAIFASRVLRLGSRIERTFLRHLTGRLFMTVADLSLGLGAYDSQCGAKIFHRSVVQKAFAETFQSRWIFDIEIIIRLKRAHLIAEYPVEAWKEIAGSKLMTPRNILRVIAEMIRLRGFYR